MKIRVNPLLLGAFLVGAVALIAAALLVFGSHNPFKPVAHFVCYLPGSSQGLSKGAAVSLNGVQIGEVDQVEVVYDRVTLDSKVRLLCQISGEHLLDASGRRIPLTRSGAIESLVHEGLRAELATAGLVGAKYIDLSFAKPPLPPSETGPPSKYPVVPTVPSEMTEITQDAQQIVANLKKTDFAALARDARTLLVSLDRQMDELQTNHLTDHLSTAAASIERLAGSTNLQALLVRAQGAVSNLDLLMTNLNTQVTTLAGQAGDTLGRAKVSLSSIDQAAKDIQDFVDLRNQLGEQTRGLEEQLTQTARTIEELADFLERHPNSLIIGRSEPPGTP